MRIGRQCRLQEMQLLNELKPPSVPAPDSLAIREIAGKVGLGTGQVTFPLLLSAIAPRRRAFVPSHLDIGMAILPTSRSTKEASPVLCRTTRPLATR